MHLVSEDTSVSDLPMVAWKATAQLNYMYEIDLNGAP